VCQGDNEPVAQCLPENATLLPAPRRDIDVAVEQNIIVLAAAGNYWPWVVSPASIPSCIAIAATNINAMPWNNSASGNAVDFSAPGESVWRALRNEDTDPENEAAPACGTSLSTAAVAGVAALWIAHYGQLKLDAWCPTGWYWQDLFRNHVIQTAREPATWDVDRYGAGIVDVQKLLTTPFERPSSSQNRHNLYFPVTTVTAQLPLLFNNYNFTSWISDARMLIASSKESEQSTNADVNNKSASFNYLDVLIDIYGRKREKKTTFLLSNLMQIGLHRGEELGLTWLKDEMDIWGAELTYLNYSHPEFYHLFLAMIDYEDIPIKKKISILLNQLDKISSKTLVSRLDPGKN
jgi:subtilisin family serine protease